MFEEAFPDELQRALARADAWEMIEQIDDFAAYVANGAGEWPDSSADDFEEIITCQHDDPEKALAYVVLAGWRSDDPRFLSFMGNGLLEGVLMSPSAQSLRRIIAEARRSARFRWILSHACEGMVDEAAWKEIAQYRISSSRAPPDDETLPPRTGKLM
jgi:hypothetical protein